MRNPPRILSIEDEATVRRSMMVYLSDSGYEVLEAENGRIGLERILTDQPDLILCDLRMPEVDGLKVLDEVKRLMPDTPFIVVSGTGDMRDVIQALRLGAWDYLMKPIEDMGVLDHAVTRALQQARLIQQNQRYHEELVATNRRLQQSLQQLQEDETAARNIQFQLLPQHPWAVDDLVFDYFIRTSAFLSGDFLDYFRIDDSRLGLYVADVSGHGASSAFVTVLLKSTVSRLLNEYREFKIQTVLLPDRVLSLINDAIVERQFNKYLTMFYAVVDTAAGIVKYCNAGHFPYPIYHDGHAARFLEDRNLPVGLFDGSTYATKELAFQGPFTLTMFSDGVLEVLPSDLIPEKEALLLSRMNAGDPDVEMLVETLGLTQQDQVPDDITLLQLRKGG